MLMNWEFRLTWVKNHLQKHNQTGNEIVQGYIPMQHVLLTTEYTWYND